MAERRDYIALDWVAGEIRDTLTQAEQALDAYIANRDDVTKLRFCLTHIHQVHGTLQMVEFFGAALLAEEMEVLANSLVQEKIHDSHIDDALGVLKTSIKQLPLYLEKVKESRKGLPATLLPVLNDLRAVQGESLLSETVLFVPEMSEASGIASGDSSVTGSELIEAAHKLRQMYQIALLGMLRGSDIKKNLNFLAKVCARLSKITDGTASQPLWKICIAVLEGLLNGSIENSVSVKILLRQIDRQIKLIIAEGEIVVQQPAPENLLKNLLYYVARSKANSRYIQEIKVAYKLDASLLGEDELSADDGAVSGSENNAMKSVVEALVVELADIRNALENANTDISLLTDSLPLFRRVSDTMAVLGMGNGLKQVQQAHSQLAKYLATQDAISSDDINIIVKQLEEAESLLNPSLIVDEETEDEKVLFNDSEEAQEQLDKAFESILRESRNGLEQAKESIIEFVASQWKHETLEEVPSLLSEIEGSLNIVPLSKAAAIVQSCQRYVEEKLLKDQLVPEWQMLDTLADAITSIDYYLERLSDDSENDNLAVLDLAAESVSELGYPIDDWQGKSSVDATELLSADDAIPVITDKVADNLVAVSDVEVDDQENENEDFDPEIVDIFIEEAGEVLDVISEFLPQWKASLSDEESRTTVRRAFHTLKGSGRMVGATDIGDLGWSIENMLNRVMDGSIEMDSARFELIDVVVEKVPSLVSAFEKRQPINKEELAALIERADVLSKEQSPDLSVLDSSSSHEIEQNQVVVEENVIDQELLEVFTTETEAHEKVVDEFIDHCRELAGPADLTDELQRALHTMKGSANMAGVIPVVMVVTPLERVIKELRASNLKADETVVEMLERGSTLIKLGINQLMTSPLQKIDGVDEYVEALESLRDQRLAAVEINSDDGAIPPEALNQFLTDSLDRITEVSAKLTLWREDELPVSDIEQFENLLGQFIDHAESINMLAPVELGNALQALYRRATEQDANNISDDFFGLVMRGNDALIDMLDQIAGQQTPVYDLSLFNEIQDFEFISSVPDAEKDADATDHLIDFEDVELDESDITDANVGSVEDDSGVVLDASALAGLGIDVGNDADDSIVDALSDFDDQVDITSLENVGDVDIVVEIPNEDTIEDSDVEQLETAQVNEKLTIDDKEIAEIIQNFIDVIALSVDEIQSQDQNIEESASDEIDSVDVKSDDTVVDDITAGVDEIAEDVTDNELTGSLHSEKENDEEDEKVDQEIIDIFLEEADDLLEDMDETVHKWDEDRNSREHLDDMLRILHTMKGGARLTGLTELGNLTHNFETSLISSDAKGLNVNDAFIANIQQQHDQIIALVNAAKAGEEPPVPEVVEELIVTTQEPLAKPSAEEILDESISSVIESQDDVNNGGVDELAAQSADDMPSEPVNIPGREIDHSLKDVVPFVAAAKHSQAPKPENKAGSSAQKTSQEMVKVSAQLLENLVNLAGETAISRSRGEEQISDLVFSLDEMQITVDRLQEQVRRLDLETEAQILYRQEQVESEGMEGFDPLEMDRYSKLQQLSRSLLESSSDLIDIKNTLGDRSRDMETLLLQQSRINTELQEGLMRSRMVPFSRMLPRLRRIIRQVSGELNKRVDFKLENIEGELDRTVLERMVAPLEHMLRNAVDHGIEESSDREKAGKPKKGKITLDLAREGGEIVITLSDDGAGIDLEAVRNKAIEKGLMEPDADLTDYEILQFIVQSGFSTAASVTQISGRGVGMDVVHSEIKQLGGSMEIDSELGKGTRFTVRLPFTVSVNRALMVNIGGDIYAIPLSSIEGIVRVSPFELEAYYQPDAPMFEYAGQSYLMRYMGALLNRGEKPNLDGLSMPLPVILVRGTEHSVAIQVDSLMGSREIVVKPLGPQFGMVQGLSGATVLGDGSVVVILDLLAMIRADASHLYRDNLTQVNQADSDRNILVMVTDDSVTVRKVTSRLLERQGMDVVLAKDGADAMAQLNDMEQLPDVMLLDIEMPRMDGFEVLSRVRHTDRLQGIPIIMITSRTGEKHRDRAISLGVNDYLGKPYQEAQLLELISELTGAETN